MFIGREQELSELERLYASDAFEMPVIYGRRRVGKTSLITHFTQGKRAIYFQARRTNAEANLSLMSAAILAATGLPQGTFPSFDAAFDALLELSRSERLVFVIDEYPYLAQSFPAISSLLQERIDHQLKDGSKLMLMLCGSSLSFMEEQVLGYESPIYGRRTAQFKILPFDFQTTRLAWPGVSAKDAALLYGVTGGVPAYVEKVDPSLSVRDNIGKLFLSPAGYFYEEPGNLLLQECRAPEQYDALIGAVASGKSKLTEIATTTGIPQSNASTYLAKLISLGIVAREYPFGETSNKKSIYKLADPMFVFWYRFVPQLSGLIENGLADAAWSRIEPQLSAFMGPIFEALCTQYLYAEARAGRLGMLPLEVGRWWGNDPRTRSQEEIDIVARDESRMLFAECKWRNDPVGADVVDKLVWRSKLFHPAAYSYLVFSKSGFTSGARERAGELGVRLVTFGQMCGEEEAC